LAIVLEISAGPDRWAELARAVTDSGGRVTEFNPPLEALKRQVYRLRFSTGAYFAAICVRTFYPEVPVVVEIDDPAQHYHIPLLLSPFGYSTYRGS
jgi:5-hydroxyisourate hydrolase